MIRFMKACRITEMGAFHAEILRFLIHQFNKSVDRAGCPEGKRVDTVGAGRKERAVKQVDDSYFIPDIITDDRSIGFGKAAQHLFGDGDDLAGVRDVLDRQNDAHHLRQRCRIHRHIGVFLIKDLSDPGVFDIDIFGTDFQFGGSFDRECRTEQQADSQQGKQFFHIFILCDFETVENAE